MSHAQPRLPGWDTARKLGVYRVRNGIIRRVEFRSKLARLTKKLDATAEVPPRTNGSMHILIRIDRSLLKDRALLAEAICHEVNHAAITLFCSLGAASNSEEFACIVCGKVTPALLRVYDLLKEE